MQLNSYMKTATNKRILISESHDDSNRYTPYRGKSDQHDIYASHASPRTTDIRFLTVVPVHGKLSWVIDRVKQGHCSREKGLLIQSTTRWPIHGSVPSFSPEPTLKQWGQSQASVDDRLLGLLGSYHQHAIDTFNTCSWGLTHRSLTDTCGGYSLEGVRFPHTTLGPFEPTVLPFPPKGPARSSDYQKSTTDSKVQV
jgi:hypothetical protein